MWRVVSVGTCHNSPVCRALGLGACRTRDWSPGSTSISRSSLSAPSYSPSPSSRSSEYYPCLKLGRGSSLARSDPAVSRSLQCDRLRIHRNFMVSLVLLYLTTIVYFLPYIQDDPQVRSRGERENLKNVVKISQIVPWYKTSPWLCNLLLSTLMFAFQVW